LVLLNFGVLWITVAQKALLTFANNEVLNFVGDGFLV